MTDTELKQAISLLIQSNFDSKRKKDSENRKILDLFNEGFDISLTDVGPRKITSLMLQQALWRVMNKSKPLDFELHGNNRPPWMEQLTTYGLSTICNRSEYVDILRSKQGVFWNGFLYGDGFYMMGTDQDEQMPINYSVVPNSNFYVDQFATAIRTTKGRSATEIFVIFSMDVDSAYAMYPVLKRNKVVGQIPRDIAAYINIETGRDYLQTWRLGKKQIEIGYYYNICDNNKPIFGIVAGTQMFVLDKVQNEKYPFFKDKQAYIPVGQFQCMPSGEGFYNKGLGNILYRFANVNRMLLNLAVGHAEDSVYPLTLLNVAQGTAGQFLQSLQEGYKQRALGAKPIIPLEYDTANPNGGRVASQSLITSAAMNEFVTLRGIIAEEIRRCGINLDDIENGPGITATQILAEEENSNAWLKQIHEYNASEQKFSLEIMIDLVKKFVKKNNQTKLDIPVAIKMEGVNVKNSEFTLGALADEWRMHHYFIKINSRTGVIPSNSMKQAQLSRVLPLLQPGSPQYQDVLNQFAQLNDVDIDTSSMTPQPEQATPQAGPAQELPSTPVPAENDRMSFNPQKQGQPSIL